MGIPDHTQNRGVVFLVMPLQAVNLTPVFLWAAPACIAFTLRDEGLRVRMLFLHTTLPHRRQRELLTEHPPTVKNYKLFLRFGKLQLPMELGSWSIVGVGLVRAICDRAGLSLPEAVGGAEVYPGIRFAQALELVEPALPERKG